jgi:hypothetical protein
MDDDLPYIKIPLSVFRRFRRGQECRHGSHAVSVPTTAPARSQRGHKKMGQTKWKAPPRPGRRPLNPDAVSAQGSHTGSLQQVSPSNLATVKRKILDLAEGEADPWWKSSWKRDGQPILPWPSRVSVSAMLPDIVTTIHRSTHQRVYRKPAAHLLKDDLSQDDYDTFCTFLKKKRCVLGTCASWPWRQGAGIPPWRKCWTLWPARHLP